MKTNKPPETPMLTPTPIHVLVTHAEPMAHRGIVATLREDARFLVCEQTPDNAHSPYALGRNTPVRVIVADLAAGIEAAQTLRQDRIHRLAPLAAVLVVSPVDSEMNVRRALEHGVSGYLPQSCQPDQLIDATLALARGQRYLERSVAQRLADAMTQDLPTPREIDVLRLLSIGLCNKAISSELDIAVGTVKAHIKALLQKLDAATRTEAADVARRRGLLDPTDTDMALSRSRRHGMRGGQFQEASSGRELSAA
jgi:DNA-binding NarL/FixJ family response regulator